MLSVSNFFKNQIFSQLPNTCFFSFTIQTNSDYTNDLINFNSIDKNSANLSMGNVSVSIDNTSGQQNIYQVPSNSYLMLKEAQLKLNIVTDSGTLDSLPIFTGLITGVGLGPIANFRLNDKRERLLKKRIGNGANPVNSWNLSADGYNPADMVFGLLVGAADFDSTSGSGNVDIHYDTWLKWKMDLDTLGYRLHGHFEGDGLYNTLKLISSLTLSQFSVEADNKLYIKKRFPELPTVNSVYNEDLILNVNNYDVSLTKLQNRMHINFGYNTGSQTWDGTLHDANTVSVQSMGIYEETFQTTNIWHSTSKSAQAYANEALARFSVQGVNASFKVPLMGIVQQIEDKILLTSSLFQINSQAFFVNKVSLHKDFSVTLNAEKDTDGESWFFLDHAVQGLLDKSYNPIY